MKNIIKNLIFVFIFFSILGVGAEISLAASSPSIISGTASSITTNSATLNGIVNPNGDDTTAWFETPSAGPLQTQNIGNGTADISLLSYNLTGLTSNTTYTFKIMAGNASGSTDSGFIFSFTTNADPVPPVLPSPSIISGTTTGITATSATLNGIVNPNGYTTTAWFETPSSGPLQTQNIGNGTTDVSLLSYDLTGLTPSTTYTFKIKAGNENGPVDGVWISFTTNAPPLGPILLPPTIISGTASSITTNSATLNGIVNPNGDDTTAWFETPSAGPLQTQNIGNGTADISLLSYNLTGLTSNTTYTFKIMAGNANGPVDGNWISFTTASSAGGGGGGGGTGGGGGGSCLIPTITSLSPSSVNEGSGAVIVTVTGTNFINGTSSGLFNGVSKVTNFINTTSLTINLIATDVLSAGSKNITIANGACVSSSSTFTVNTNVPVGSGGTTSGGGGGIPYPNSTTSATTATGETKIIKKQTTSSKTTNKENLINNPSIDYSEIKTAEINISTTKEDVAVGDEVNYSIIFKNVLQKNLENIKIIVHLPKEVDFKESNIGVAGDDNTVILDSEVLFSEQSNTLTIKGIVNSNALLQSVITTTASATYNVAGSSLKKEEISYVTNYIVANISLTANSLFSVTYIPYWIGLVILLFIVISLIIVRKRIYKK